MPGRRMLMSDLPWILEDPKSDYCIRSVCVSKIYFNWEEVQKHYNIKTQEDSFVHNLRTNYGWTKTCPCDTPCSCLVSKKGYWKHPDLESRTVASVRDLQPKPSTRIRKRQRRRELKELAKKKQEEAELRAQQAEAKLREVTRLVGLTDSSSLNEVSGIGQTATKSRRTFDNSNPRKEMSNTNSITQSPSSTTTDSSSSSSSTSPIPETSLGDSAIMRQQQQLSHAQQQQMLQNGLFLPASYSGFPHQTFPHHQTFSHPTAALQMQNQVFQQQQEFFSNQQLAPLVVPSDSPKSGSEIDLPSFPPKMQIMTSSDEDLKGGILKLDQSSSKTIDANNSDWSDSSPQHSQQRVRANSLNRGVSNASTDSSLSQVSQQSLPQQQQIQPPPTMSMPTISSQQSTGIPPSLPPLPRGAFPTFSHINTQRTPQTTTTTNHGTSLPPLTIHTTNAPQIGFTTTTTNHVAPHHPHPTSVSQSGALSLGMQNHDARSIAAAAQLSLRMLMDKQSVPGLNGLTQNVNVPQTMVDDLHSKLLFRNPTTTITTQQQQMFQPPPPTAAAAFSQPVPQPYLAAMPNVNRTPQDLFATRNDILQPGIFPNIPMRAVQQTETPALKPIQELSFIDT